LKPIVIYRLEQFYRNRIVQILGVALIIFLCPCSMIVHIFDEDRWDPDEYFSHVKIYEAWALQRLNSHKFFGDERILDYGCRDGRISGVLANKVPQGTVVGIDTSSSMIEYARMKSAHLKNLEFYWVQQTLECMEKYDVITSFFVMNWTDDIASKMMQFQKCLETGGVLWVVSTFDIPKQAQVAMQKFFSHSKWKSYFENYTFPLRFYSIEEYRSFCSEAGLQLIDLKILEGGYEVFPSRANFESYLKQIFPIIDILPVELRDECMSDYIDIYLEICPPDKHGRIFVYRDIFELKARNP